VPQLAKERLSTIEELVKSELNEIVAVVRPSAAAAAPAARSSRVWPP
jgi:hypothetical protein